MENLNSIITLQALLKGRNKDFDNTHWSNIQLVRHAYTIERAKKNDKNLKKGNKGKEEILIDGKPVPPGISNIYELYIYRRDLFEKYQSEQKKGRFDKIKYWVVFLGEKESTSRFLGIYEIMGRKQSPHKQEEEILDLRHLSEFQFLEEKVIIDWSKSPLNWYLYYNKERQVLRIEEGLTKSDGTPVFRNYEDIILDFVQLNKVLKDQDWIKVLKAINCIYLITDKSNGKVYVGSTSGKERIFQRWAQYGKDGHGGNVELEKLIKKDSQYHIKNFQWTILETLKSNITQQEAVERENLWKRKMLSLEHGYNNN